MAGGVTSLAPQVNQHGGVDHRDLETAHPLSVVDGQVVLCTLVVALVDKGEGQSEYLIMERLMFVIRERGKVLLLSSSL